MPDTYTPTENIEFRCSCGNSMFTKIEEFTCGQGKPSTKHRNTPGGEAFGCFVCHLVWVRELRAAGSTWFAWQWGGTSWTPVLDAVAKSVAEVESNGTWSN